MLRGALPPALPPAAAPARGLREIYATHTSVDGAACVRVYQAYSAPIAARAAAANSFAAPLADGLWSGERVSWIKPSAAWMAYRCGWTLLKDAAQARVLALDLDRAAFMRLLARARVTHGEPAGGLKGAPVHKGPSTRPGGGGVSPEASSISLLPGILLNCPLGGAAGFRQLGAGPGIEVGRLVLLRSWSPAEIRPACTSSAEVCPLTQRSVSPSGPPRSSTRSQRRRQRSACGRTASRQ